MSGLTWGLMSRVGMLVGQARTVRKGLSVWSMVVTPHHPTTGIPCPTKVWADFAPSVYDVEQRRYYAKSKDKKGKSKQAKAHVSLEEMEEVVNVERMQHQLSHILEDLKQNYINNLSLRSSVGSLESLPVELEGDTYPLNEVAQLFRKSPQLVIINASSFPQALPGILTAIREAGMNLNPQQEGTSIILPIPKVTKEHRENLSKNAKTLYNKCKEQLRDVQNQYIRKAKNKEGTVSEDLIYNVQLKIREMAEESMHEAETMMTAKQKELLQTNK